MKSFINLGTIETFSITLENLDDQIGAGNQLAEDSYLSIDWTTEWGLVEVPGFSIPILERLKKYLNYYKFLILWLYFKSWWKVAVDLELYNNVAAGSIDGTELNLNLDTNQVQGLQVTIFIFISLINKYFYIR